MTIWFATNWFKLQLFVFYSYSAEYYTPTIQYSPNCNQEQRSRGRQRWIDIVSTTWRTCGSRWRTHGIVLNGEGENCLIAPIVSEVNRFLSCDVDENQTALELWRQRSSDAIKIVGLPTSFRDGQDLSCHQSRQCASGIHVQHSSQHAKFQTIINGTI